MSSLGSLNCSTDFTRNLRERKLKFAGSSSVKVPILEPRVCLPARHRLRFNHQSNSFRRKLSTVVRAVSSTEIRYCCCSVRLWISLDVRSISILGNSYPSVKFLCPAPPVPFQMVLLNPTLRLLLAGMPATNTFLDVNVAR